MYDFKANRHRILMSGIGIVLCGIGVGFMRQASFGVDPFQMFCQGLDNVIPIPYGTLYVIINGVLLLAMLAWARSYIGVTTFINMFFLGYLIDFSQKAMVGLFGVPGSLLWRVVNLALGLVVLCLASSLIFTSNLGVSTYDWIALMPSDRNSKLPFRFLRIGTDLVCVTIGLLLGVSTGVGTLITAFFMGPLTDCFRIRVAQPLLLYWTK